MILHGFLGSFLCSVLTQVESSMSPRATGQAVRSVANLVTSTAFRGAELNENVRAFSYICCFIVLELICTFETGSHWSRFISFLVQGVWAPVVAMD